MDWVILDFQVKPYYDESELESLLETLDRRGAICAHAGLGRHRVRIPLEHWIPFFFSIRDCASVQLTDIKTISQLQLQG